MKYKDLSKKVEAFKQQKKELEAKEELLDVVIASITTDEKFNKTSEELIVALENIRESIIEAFRSSPITDAISNQTKELKDTTGERLIVKVENLIKEVKKLDKEGFSHNEFNQAFNKGLEKVVNILIDQNQIPEETRYTRNRLGKISTVTEVYPGYTLKSTWSYDSNNKLISVKTVKNETQ